MSKLNKSIILFLYTMSIAASASDLNTKQDKISYTAGYSIALNLPKKLKKKLDLKQVLKGLNQALVTHKPSLSKTKIQSAISVWQTTIQKKRKLSKTVLLKASLAVGIQISDGIKKKMGKFVNFNKMILGFQDGFDSNDKYSSILTRGDLQRYAKILQQKLQQPQSESSKKILQAGKKYLAKNKKRSGVTTLPNGLQYEILNKRSGKKPKMSDKVEVHYAGSLIDGTVFDSSYKRGQAAVFGVTQVIKGWTDILQMMPIGSKWRVYIPYNLAYGERGSPPTIPPFSTLIFDIELISIK